MYARLGGWLGVVLAVLLSVAVGCGGAAGTQPTSLLIADVQAAEVLVKRQGATSTVPAYVGMQLFPGDTLRSTASAEVTLFDDTTGTMTQVVSPDGPFVVGGAGPVTGKGLVSGLRSSLSDLFGSAAEARKRDSEVGAVQAGMMLARLPDQQKLRNALRVPQLNGKFAPSPAAAPAVAAPQPDAMSLDDDPIPDPAAPAAMPAPAASAAGPELGAPEGVDTEAFSARPRGLPELSGGRAPVPGKEPAPPRGGDNMPGAKDQLEGGGPTVLLARLEKLNGAWPLARARRVSVTGTVPAVAAAPGQGRTFLGSAGSSIRSLDQTLGDGARCAVRVEPQSGEPWELELVIAPRSEWNAARDAARKLLRSKVPNAKLLAANLLESRGFVLMAHKLRLLGLLELEGSGRKDALMLSVYGGVGRSALELGDWPTVSRIQKLSVPGK